MARFQSEAAIHEQIANGRQYSILLDSKKTAVGSLAIDSVSDYRFLSKLYVHSEYQDRGVGRWVLAELARRELTLDIRHTVNKQNHSAISFYEGNGFRNCGSIITEIGKGYLMDDWGMVKDTTRLSLAFDHLLLYALCIVQTIPLNSCFCLARASSGSPDLAHLG